MAKSYIKQSFKTFILMRKLVSQMSKGGPIIAWQLENEYGSYGNDSVYKDFLHELYLRHGVTELLFTSDNGTGIQRGHIQNGTLDLSLC